VSVLKFVPFGKVFNSTQQLVSRLLFEEDFLFVKNFAINFRKVEISAFQSGNEFFEMP